MASKWLRRAGRRASGGPRALRVAVWVALASFAAPGTARAQQDSAKEMEALRKRQEELAGALDALAKERAEAKAREDRLVQELADLRRQFSDLKARAILAEKVEETKRIPEWLCPSGHVHDAPAEGGKCPDCGGAQERREAIRTVRVARREAIGDKIAAALEEDAKKRLTVATSATGVFQQIVNNTSPATDNTGHAEGSFDLYFITTPLPYSVFFIDLEAVGGQGPDREIGSLANLNSDAGRNVVQDEGNDSVNVREVWLKSDLFQDRLHLVAGKLDLSNYFDRNKAANDETTQFLTDAFVNNPVLGTPAQNGPGVSAWYETKTGWAFGLGFQKPSDEGFRVGDGDYAIAEVDWRTYLLGREGNVRAWGRRDGRSADTEAFESWAGGVSLDQEVSSALTVFARFGSADVANATDAWAYSAGVQARGLFESRPRDVWGFAFGQQRGSIARDERDRDTALETYYRFFVNEHVSVSPIFQYLVHTAGNGDDLPAQDDVAVLGLRVQIDF
ncbi:MAG: carbohydrate porin [Planctomycetes bacterium]|nr:carbohydrate porin [Planctomycetota bacterium]